MSQPTWLTPKQVAALVGCKPETLVKWRYLGRGPDFNKPAGRVRYDERDVLEFIAAGSKKAV
jgi:predicted site-specific integrase-resolvase